MMAKSARKREAANRLITAKSGASGETGTPLANIDIIQSCRLAFRSGRQKGTWGGARNRADRVSQNLTRRQCEGILAAAARLEKQSMTFNRHWTVHYERAGIRDSDGAAFIGKLLKRAGEHVRRTGGTMAAIWIRENGEGKGAHVHILLHLSGTATLQNLTRRWIKAAGGTYRKGVSEVRSIGGTLASAKANTERHNANVGNVLAYLMKGASDHTGRELGLNRYGAGGSIIGKRCGWTQNIGQASRQFLLGNNGRADG